MVKVTGDKIFRNRLARMRNAPAGQIARLYRDGEKVRKEAANSIIAGSISGPGHIPSAPGEPPNRDTSNLDKSIDVRVDRQRGRVDVIASAPYSAALEFGTSTIEERPFMRPALRKHRNAIVRGQVQTIREQLVGVVKNRPYGTGSGQD